MERARKRSHKRKAVEIELLKNNANMNLNESISANRGNPYIGGQLNENSPFLMKVFFAFIAFGLIFSLIFFFVVSISPNLPSLGPVLVLALLFLLIYEALGMISKMHRTSH